MAKSTNYRGIHISVIYEYGYDYYEIREINKGKKWNDVTLFSTLKEAKQYIDDHYDELVKLCNVKESKSYARKSLKEAKNGYYIYTKLDNKYAYCDKSKFTEEEGFYLIEDYMLDAIHIFKTEKEAEKFIDEDLNRFMVKKDNVVIDEYPSTKGGFFESKESARKSIKEAKTVTCISCEKNLNDYRNDPMCTQTWDYADGDSKWYQKSIYECIEDAKNFMKKGYLCYIDGELFNKPDAFEDESYFKMEIKPKSSAKKSMKESKVMSFEEFKKLCDDNFGYAIMDFNEYKGSYIVVVSSNEKATEKFAKILGKHEFECTFYELKDPNSEYYRCYEIMCI